MTCRVAKLDPCPPLSTGLNAHLNVAGGRPVHNNQALASTAPPCAASRRFHRYAFVSEAAGNCTAMVLHYWLAVMGFGGPRRL